LGKSELRLDLESIIKPGSLKFVGGDEKVEEGGDGDGKEI